VAPLMSVSSSVMSSTPHSAAADSAFDFRNT
jgi:hypothetical protein